MHRKLPWPASKVERDVLHQLWCESKAAGLPITAIVKTAIDDYLNRRLAAMPTSSSTVVAGVPVQAA